MPFSSVARTLVLRVSLAMLLVLGCIPAFGLPKAQDAQKIRPTEAVVFKGIVTITTSSDGMWTFVTLPPVEAGKPLAAAFALQYDNAATSPISFKGEGELVFTKIALMVKARDGRTWLFKLPEYGGDIPAGASVVEPIGIARYTWRPAEHVFPSSHDEFVERHSQTAGCQAAQDGANPFSPGCDQCVAGGGGSTACSVQGNGGCSVTCGAGYFACCNPGSCHCCHDK